MNFREKIQTTQINILQKNCEIYTISLISCLTHAPFLDFFKFIEKNNMKFFHLWQIVKIFAVKKSESKIIKNFWINLVGDANRRRLIK